MRDLHREHPKSTQVEANWCQSRQYEFGEWCEDDFGLCLELRRKMLEREEGNMGDAEGKRESGELGKRFEEQVEEVAL